MTDISKHRHKPLRSSQELCEVVAASGNSTKILNYAAFVQEFLKKKALWDTSRSYTKRERNQALTSLAMALNANVHWRAMLQLCLRLKKMQMKRVQTCLRWCVNNKYPLELTMYRPGTPQWVRDLEAKLQMLPELIQQFRALGILPPEDKSLVAWANFVHCIAEQCHRTRRLPTMEDVKMVADTFGLKNYELMYRLWERQKEAAVTKYRYLVQSGDVVKELSFAPAHLEWRVVDLVASYDGEFNVLYFDQSQSYKANLIQPLLTLFHLVKVCKIEENNGAEDSEKWARLVSSYSRKFMTSPSGIVLQRRWHSLKRLSRVGVLQRLRQPGCRVHPLFVEVAARYPHVLRGEGAWEGGCDVTNIQVDYMSDDEYCDESRDANEADKTTDCVPEDSDFDSEDDKPLIIDEEKNLRPIAHASYAENDDESTFSAVDTDDTDDYTPKPRKNPTKDVTNINANISLNTVKENEQNEIATFNNEFETQLNDLIPNEINAAELKSINKIIINFPESILESGFVKLEKDFEQQMSNIRKLKLPNFSSDSFKEKSVPISSVEEQGNNEIDDIFNDTTANVEATRAKVDSPSTSKDTQSTSKCDNNNKANKDGNAKTKDSNDNQSSNMHSLTDENAVVATIYSCRASDGTEIGNVVIPGSVNNLESVTMKLKSDNGLLAIDSCVVNNTDNSKSAAKESDLDLLQKIDPAQAESVIIFSDSEEDNEISNELKLAKSPKKDHLNLDDVKKYLSTHSLDDILTKMDDMAVKQDVKKDKEENRTCKSYIYVSDSDSSDVDYKSNGTKKNSNVIDIQDDSLDKEGSLISCRSKEFSMINTVASKTDQEKPIQSNALDIPNANVLIIPPSVFLPAMNVFNLAENAVPTQNVTATTPNLNTSINLLNPGANLVITNPVINPTPIVTVPTPNVTYPTSTVMIPTPYITNPTSSVIVPNPTHCLPKPVVESPTTNVSIRTPKSNIVTMIINDKIGKDSIPESSSNNDTDIANKQTSNTDTNYGNQPKRKIRKTKTYTDALGYSGLFKLKERSTKETVGMLCRIKDETNLVDEVTKKIDNYLEKVKEDPIEEQEEEEREDERSNEFYKILSKKMEIESNRDNCSGGFLKTMLDKSETKTLWTTEESLNEEPIAIDPKLIMDARVYLPKVDEVDSYIKNRRVDFSINTKRISKYGRKILNYIRKSDPLPIVDASLPVVQHIESEISVALKKKIPESNNVTRKRPMSSDRHHKTPKETALEVNTEKLNELTKRIKIERELQSQINSQSKRCKASPILDKMDNLTDKIRNERLMQQLINEKVPNIVQRIKFEVDDSDLFTEETSQNDLESTGEVLTQEKESDNIQKIIEGKIRDAFNKSNERDVIKSTEEMADNNCESENMEIETIGNDTLILDSSNQQSASSDYQADITTEASENGVEIPTNDLFTEYTPGRKNVPEENAFVISNIKSEIDDTTSTNEDMSETNNTESIIKDVTIKTENINIDIEENKQAQSINEHSYEETEICCTRVKKRWSSSDDINENKHSNHKNDSIKDQNNSLQIVKTESNADSTSANNDLLENKDCNYKNDPIKDQNDSIIKDSSSQVDKIESNNVSTSAKNDLLENKDCNHKNDPIKDQNDSIIKDSSSQVDKIELNNVSSNYDLLENKDCNHKNDSIKDQNKTLPIDNIESNNDSTSARNDLLENKDCNNKKDSMIEVSMQKDNIESNNDSTTAKNDLLENKDCNNKIDSMIEVSMQIDNIESNNDSTTAKNDLLENKDCNNKKDSMIEVSMQKDNIESNNDSTTAKNDLLENKDCNNKNDSIKDQNNSMIKVSLQMDNIESNNDTTSANNDLLENKDDEEPNHENDSTNDGNFITIEVPALRIDDDVSIKSDEEVNDTFQETCQYSSSDDESVNNINDMLKMCKPVKLCLERVKVPKDTSQVRRVELPDRTSLKRHSAPTAHVAPINVRSRDNESNAKETEIGDLLQQLSMETASEWQRLEEARIRNEGSFFKRFKFHHTPSRDCSKKINVKMEQNTEKPARRGRRAKESIESTPPTYNSDDEVADDPSLKEWQRQKNINYRFFNFNPVSQTMDPDTTQPKKRKWENRKTKKKQELLIKKLVVEPNAADMNESQELKDIQEFHKAIDSKEIDNAVRSIKSEIDSDSSVSKGIRSQEDVKVYSGSGIGIGKEDSVRVFSGNGISSKVAQKRNFRSRLLVPKIYFEDLDENTQTDVLCINVNSNFNKIASNSKHEDGNEWNKEERVFQSKKDFTTLPSKNIAPKSKGIVQDNALPSTSKDSYVVQNELSYESSNLICISDDSNEIFELTQTMSVKNNDNSKSEELPAHLAVKKENLNKFKAKNESINKIIDNQTKNSDEKVKCNQNESLKKGKEDNYNQVRQPNNTDKNNSSSNTFLLQNDNNFNPPVKVIQKMTDFGSVESKSDTRMMEIRPIGSNVKEEEVEGNETRPQIENVISIPESVYLDNESSNDRKYYIESNNDDVDAPSVFDDVPTELYTNPAITIEKVYSRNVKRNVSVEKNPITLIKLPLSGKKPKISTNENISEISEGPSNRDIGKETPNFSYQSIESNDGLENDKIGLNNDVNNITSNKEEDDFEPSHIDEDSCIKQTSVIQSTSVIEEKEQPYSTDEIHLEPRDDGNIKVINNCQFNTGIESQNTDNVVEKSLNSETEQQNNIEPTKDNENKTKSFLKVVPIQKLRGDPISGDEDAGKPRGQAMPFHCTDATQNEELALNGMPVISNVVSLSTKANTSEQSTSDTPLAGPSSSTQDDPLKTRVWRPLLDKPLLDPCPLSNRPSVCVADFIRERDCTNITLLCVSGHRAMWTVPSSPDKGAAHYAVVSNLRPPDAAAPTYWSVAPRDDCVRVLMDETVAGSTVVGALSVPDEVFLDNHWYKKLNSDRLIYAKIWYAVPNFKTCREMIMSCNNIQMHFYSLATGAMLPFNASVLSDTVSKPTYYKINTSNISLEKLQQLVAMIQKTLQSNNGGQLIIGHLEGGEVPERLTVSTVAEPFQSGEVISLDSDDE